MHVYNKLHNVHRPRAHIIRILINIMQISLSKKILRKQFNDSKKSKIFFGCKT